MVYTFLPGPMVYTFSLVFTRAWQMHHTFLCSVASGDRLKEEGCHGGGI